MRLFICCEADIVLVDTAGESDPFVHDWPKVQILLFFLRDFHLTWGPVGTRIWTRAGQLTQMSLPSKIHYDKKLGVF